MLPRFLTACAVAFLSLWLADTAVQAQSAQSYPSQTIRIFVQAAPGGLPDTVGRIVTRRLQERLNATMVVENRPGANGGVAAAALVQQPADGYTFLVTDGSVVSINPVLNTKIPYNPADLLPVVMLARAPLFLAAHPQVPVKNMQEFIDYVRKNPGKLNYGSSGVGSTHHLSMEAIKAALKLDMTHVPFKGTGESVPALLGGHVDVLFSAYPSLSGAIATHRVTLLATNGAKRSPQAPEAPPIADFIPGFDFAPVIGMFARVGTPQAIIDKFAAEAVATVNEPEIVKALAVTGVEAAGGGPAEYAKSLKAEVARVAETVKIAGIQPQ
jgi:tripartite-type tricarboxylate transporter receptor subunit TctC